MEFPVLHKSFPRLLLWSKPVVCDEFAASCMLVVTYHQDSWPKVSQKPVLRAAPEFLIEFTSLLKLFLVELRFPQCANFCCLPGRSWAVANCSFLSVFPTSCVVLSRNFQQFQPCSYFHWHHCPPMSILPVLQRFISCRLHCHHLSLLLISSFLEPDWLFILGVQHAGPSDQVAAKTNRWSNKLSPGNNLSQSDFATCPRVSTWRDCCE